MIHELREWIMLIAELYICVILTVEYMWGRSDTDIKKEEKRKRKKPEFDELNIGEGK